MDRKQPYHPWLLGGSILYLVALALFARARSREALLLHGFVLTHWALMALLFASQYRYRLILPMYPFVYCFAALTLWQAARVVGLGWTRGRRVLAVRPRAVSQIGSGP